MIGKNGRTIINLQVPSPKIQRGKMYCPICNCEMHKQNGTWVCGRVPLCSYPPFVAPTTTDDKSIYVVFDFETTGFSPEKDFPTELGAVKVQNGKVIDTFDYFCKTPKLIPVNVQQKTGITNEMLEAEGKEPGWVIEEFFRFIDDCAYITGHNIQRFDIKVLEATMKRERIKHKIPPYVDTLLVAKSLLAGHEDELQAIAAELNAQGEGVSKFSQPTIAKYYGHTYNAHRASEDTAALAIVYGHLQNEPGWSLQKFLHE